MTKGTTIYENYICTLLDEDCSINVTHGERMEPKGVASLVVTNQCFWCGSTHASTETASKHMAAAEQNNRCVVDACRFHYLVIDIPPDTICPRCDLIFNDTAELQRHLASMEYPPPEGRSLVINAETSVGASGSGLWQKIRDRWRARRAERETKTHQTAAWRDEGRRDDGELGAEGNRQGRQQEHGREATLRRPQDAMRALSASEGSQRRSLHVLDDRARVQKNKGAIARLLGTGGDQGKGSRPRSSRDSGLHGPVASAVGERQHSGSGQLSWCGKSPSKRGTIWNQRGHSIWYLIASWPKCTTQLWAVSNSSSAWHNTGNRFVGHSDKQERVVFSVKLQAELWNGHCQQQSNRIDKSEFCCSITSRLTYHTPSATG